MSNIFLSKLQRRTLRQESLNLAPGLAPGRWEMKSPRGSQLWRWQGDQWLRGLWEGGLAF